MQVKQGLWSWLGMEVWSGEGLRFSLLISLFYFYFFPHRPLPSSTAGNTPALVPQGHSVSSFHLSHVTRKQTLAFGFLLCHPTSSSP